MERISQTTETGINRNHAVIGYTSLSELKNYEGSIIEYFHRGKFRKMLLMAVQTEPGLIKNQYEGSVGEVRIDYVDKNVIREWSGFWTNKIERIRLISNNK